MPATFFTYIKTGLFMTDEQLKKEAAKIYRKLDPFIRAQTSKKEILRHLKRDRDGSQKSS